MPKRKKTIRIHFGPAGKPLGFKGDMPQVPKMLKEMNLDALEVLQVRRLNMTKDIAQAIRDEAKKHGIILSLHAPYAINFASEKPETIEASKERLLKALEIADWLNAKIVVFHPGYYGSHEPRKALEIAIDAIKEVAEKAKKMNLKPKIGPETMGKKSQLGSIDEIIDIVKEVPNSQPVLDFAHIHAREDGSLNTRKDYEKLFEKIESELGSRSLRNLHIHFTKVEYGDKGEKRHHIFGEGYGPKFIPLAEILIERDIEATIISESPILEQDALKMRKIVLKLLKGTKKEELEKEE